jgi:nitric oxide reductase large subunit
LSGAQPPAPLYSIDMKTAIPFKLVLDLITLVMLLWIAIGWLKDANIN